MRNETRIEAKRLMEILLDCEERLKRGPPKISIEKVPQGRLSTSERDILGCKTEADLDEGWFKRRWIETTTAFRDMVAEAHAAKVKDLSRMA